MQLFHDILLFAPLQSLLLQKTSTWLRYFFHHNDTKLNKKLLIKESVFCQHLSGVHY